MLRDLVAQVRTNLDLRREAFSMSIYVSIVLFSALTVFDDSAPPEQGEVFLLELGTTLGLVLAHGFASWLSTTVVGKASDEVDPWDLLKVQIFGALVVAGISMLAVIIAPPSIELSAARFTVAGMIAAQVFLESRANNSWLRAALYGLLALGAGVTVAVVKALLSH